MPAAFRSPLEGPDTGIKLSTGVALSISPDQMKRLK
jgi:hypothetical protein